MSNGRVKPRAFNSSFGTYGLCSRKKCKNIVSIEGHKMCSSCREVSRISSQRQRSGSYDDKPNAVDALNGMTAEELLRQATKHKEQAEKCETFMRWLIAHRKPVTGNEVSSSTGIVKDGWIYPRVNIANLDPHSPMLIKTGPKTVYNSAKFLFRELSVHLFNRVSHCRPRNLPDHFIGSYEAVAQATMKVNHKAVSRFCEDIVSGLNWEFFELTNKKTTTQTKTTAPASCTKQYDCQCGLNAKPEAIRCEGRVVLTVEELACSDFKNTEYSLREYTVEVRH
ncbi:hypothetical protein C8Q75DRAFT_805612 [Abortiporus biennis]|nr:hypothetical protein C8Q75DRAFT_805612 [Abortiporus biennis]